MSKSSRKKEIAFIFTEISDDFEPDHAFIEINRKFSIGL